jgi:hypothetical protein
MVAYQTKSGILKCCKHFTVNWPVTNCFGQELRGKNSSPQGIFDLKGKKVQKGKEKKHQEQAMHHKNIYNKRKYE